MALLILMPMATYASCQPSASDGVVSWWKFDDNALDSIGSNDCTRYNFTDGYVTGKYGQGLYFNETEQDWMTCGLFTGFSNDFTIDFWVKIGGITGDYPLVMSNQNASAIGFYILAKHLYSLNGTLFFDEASSPADYIDIFSSNEINNSMWHHIAITSKGNDSEIWEDGNNATILDLLAGIGKGETDNLNQNLTIGGNLWSFDYSNMTLDNLRIWNRSLSASEIADLYSDDNFDSCSINYTALDENHTSYKRCLNDNTYQMVFSNYDGIWYNHSSLEWCDNGCDNVTNACAPLEYEQNIWLFAILIASLVLGTWFFKWVSRR